jgi:hypothetical protein
MTTELELTGGCQCGAVRYRAQLPNDEAYLCHCRMCQRAFGHVSAAFVNTKKTKVAWEKDGRAFYAGSKIARRGFCPACGTPMTFEYLDGENIDLSVGSLDDPSRVRLASHFGVESRVPSFHRPDGLPEKRTDDAKHIVDKWKAAYGADVVMGPRS